MTALDTETMNTKEFDHYSSEYGIPQAQTLITSETSELEAVYSNYFTEKKKQLEELKEVTQYAEDLADIKAIQRAERDRIKPEKRLFELSLVVLEARKNGHDDYYITGSKAYVAAVKASGDEYIKEFVQKTDEEIKDFCVRFYMLQRQVKAELEANELFQAAKARKKEAEDAIESDLHKEKRGAMLALVELKNRRCFAPEESITG